MAVRSVTSWRVTPGRWADFTAFMAGNKKIFERLGGTVRVSTATFAGPNSGTVSLAVEHKDMAAYGAYVVKLDADPEWQKVLTDARSRTDPFGTITGRALLTDLAL